VKAFFLAGPTATGKTAVAHALAREMDLPILSTDSMLVYRGMDIGTAKPSRKERAGISYLGINLVDPDASFSTGDYIRAVKGCCDTCIATGGTGLYIKALCNGLDELPRGNPERRTALEVLEVRQLQDLLRELDPDWLAAMADPLNPRRLVRAIELAEAGIPRPTALAELARVPVVALSMDREHLRERIAQRVDLMYGQGFIEEVHALRRRFPTWSLSAEQAIGYAEAIAVLNGTLSLVEAKDQTVRRTRKLAKRQITWLNNQFDIHWVEIMPEDNPAETATRVRGLWEQRGPLPICEGP
jgi:tRNA dimethylallyltransferase